MKNWTSASIKEYLLAVSKPTPTPGGGSVAALLGALGFSLLEMSLGKSCSGHPKLREIRGLRQELLSLVDKDAQVFAEVARSWKGHSNLRNKALIRATEIPLKTCQGCAQGFHLVQSVASSVKRSLTSDLKAARYCFLASFRTATLNIRYNLSQMNHSNERDELRTKWKRLQSYVTRYM